MKKLTVVIIGIMCFAYFIPVQAEVLSDTQLAGITAGDVDTSILDDVIAENSAVASQKNIAAIGSIEGAVSAALIYNTNTADVFNLGDAAVALQTNIAAISSSGDSLGNMVMNTNDALVDNIVTIPLASATLSSESDTTGVDFNSIISDADVHGSAVASQANIAAIVSTGGSASGNLITNLNAAEVFNFGDSAVALQTNIGAIAGLGTVGSSDGNMIFNDNSAIVNNIPDLPSGTATKVSQDASTDSNPFNEVLSSVSAQTSAVASQNNIGAIIGAGGVGFASIMNTNNATVNNGL